MLSLLDTRYWTYMSNRAGKDTVCTAPACVLHHSSSAFRLRSFVTTGCVEGCEDDATPAAPPLPLQRCPSSLRPSLALYPAQRPSVDSPSTPATWPGGTHAANCPFVGSCSVVPGAFVTSPPGHVNGQRHASALLLNNPEQCVQQALLVGSAHAHHGGGVPYHRRHLWQKQPKPLVE